MDVDSRWFLVSGQGHRKFAYVALGVGILLVAISLACMLAFIDYSMMTIDDTVVGIGGRAETLLVHANTSLGLYDDAVRGLNLSDVAADLHMLVEKISNLTDLLNRVAEHFHVD